MKSFKSILLVTLFVFSLRANAFTWVLKIHNLKTSEVRTFEPRPNDNFTIPVKTKEWKCRIPPETRAKQADSRKIACVAEGKKWSQISTSVICFKDGGTFSKDDARLIVESEDTAHMLALRCE
jgi:hypothetical protein